MKIFRPSGAVGALLDEYEKSIHELQALIATISPHELTRTVDPHTKDPDCVSIQTVLSHVIRSGYGYVVAIRRHFGEINLPYPKTTLLATTKAYQTALNDMFAYNEKLFVEYPNLPLEAYDPKDKMQMRWGQLYDVEQLFEHAIVHILRHRRQIEKFLRS